MNPFQTILEYFRVKKTIRYHGTKENLESILEAMENERLEKEEFYVKKIGENQYALNPTMYLGMMQTMVNGLIVHSDEITARMNLDAQNEKLQEINLLGARHKGHIFIFVLFLFALIGSTSLLISTGQFGGIILVVVLWPIFHLWFNFIWTSQEKALIEEVKLALHIRIRADIGL